MWCPPSLTSCSDAMKLLFQVCLMTLLFAGMASADVVVVVSSKSPVTRFSPDHVAKIFIGKIKTLPNCGVALPIDQAEGSAIRDEFYAKVVHKNSSQLNAYWAKVIFTGGDSYPPQLLDGNAAVRRAVANNPCAIGYLDKSTLDSSVRIVLEP